MSQIDWSFWSAMREVRIADAVALSLDIDPDGLCWNGSSRSFDQGAEFDKRLRLLQSNSADRTAFPTACSLDLSHGWACGVVLREAGAWFEKQGYELPSSFPRISGGPAIVRTLELPESEPVCFAELPHLMASAMWPSRGEADDMTDYGVARLNLDVELKRAVKEGRLTVRNASTLERQTLNLGASLDRSVVLPREDLLPYLNARGGIDLRLIPFGTGPVYWTLESAADGLTEQQTWHRGVRDALLQRMNGAALDGRLVVLDPRTLLPFQPSVVRNFWELVRPADVNAWLKTEGAPYRWNILARPAATDGVKNFDSRQQKRDCNESKDEHTLSWWKHALGGTNWWDLNSVDPEKAALLLCGLDPDDPASDGSSLSTAGEPQGQQYKTFRNYFGDAGLDGVPRALHEWVSLAQEKGLKCHSWIAEWIAAGGATHRDDQRRKAHLKTDPVGGETLDADAVAEPPPPQRPGWTLREPKRYQGYARPLYLLLKAAHVSGGERPRPRDVLDAFKESRPSEVVQVNHDGFTYLDSSGNSKAADLAAISEAIRRMTILSAR